VNLKAELEIRHLHEKVDHLLSRQWQRRSQPAQLSASRDTGAGVCHALRSDRECAFGPSEIRSVARSGGKSRLATEPNILSNLPRIVRNEA
jgi:hypothetical protein